MRSGWFECAFFCVGAGSDSQPKLQDHIYAGQCSHDHSTHPETRSGGGGFPTFTVQLHAHFYINCL